MCREVTIEVYIVKNSGGTLLLSLDTCMQLQYLPQEFPEPLEKERWKKPTCKPAQGAEAPAQRRIWSIRSVAPDAEAQSSRAKSNSRGKQRKHARHKAFQKPLPELAVVRARVQNTATKLWDQGRLIKVNNKENCLIELGDKCVWRKRCFVRAVPGKDRELPSSLPPMASTRGRRKMMAGGNERAKFSPADERADASSPRRRSNWARRPPDQLGVRPRQS